MRFAGRVIRRVRVLVVLVVGMPVFVFQWLVVMRVSVALGEVQPDTGSHQKSGDGKAGRNRFAEEEHGDHRARASGAEMPQRQHEEDEAHAVAQDANQANGGKRGDGRQLRSEHQCEGRVDRTGTEALQHRNLHRVGSRNVTREMDVSAGGQNQPL